MIRIGGDCNSGGWIKIKMLDSYRAILAFSLASREAFSKIISMTVQASEEPIQFIDLTTLPSSEFAFSLY